MQERLLSGCVPIKTNSNSIDPDCKLMVLLISSRHKDQLTFPRGGVKATETPEKAAVRETFEEAGCVGHVIGTFRPIYDRNRGRDDNGNVHGKNEKKRIIDYELEENRVQGWQVVGDIGDEEANIQWYQLLVEKEYEDWPEKNERKRQWVMTIL